MKLLMNCYIMFLSLVKYGIIQTLLLENDLNGDGFINDI